MGTRYRKEHIIPILRNFSTYNKSDFRCDLIASINVAVLLVPQAMAYALLAGVPPIYGLYTALIPLFVYAILGTAPQLSVGPVAVSALLVLAGLSKLAEPGTEEYISLAITCGLLIGMIQIVLSLLRMGFLANFLSHPVIAGFTSAAAIIISVTQLKDVFGISVPSDSSMLESLGHIVNNISSTNPATLVIALSAMILIFILKKVNKSIPGTLIAVVIATLCAYYMRLDARGVELVKGVPDGLPSFILPDLSLETIRILIPTLITVTIVGIVESISIAKALEAKHKNYIIRPNQELLALGTSKILASFFQAIPSSASFSRSALNSDSGAKTTFSSIFAALFVALVLLFLTPLFYYLPKAVLAAIIILSVISLFDYKEAKNLWKTHKKDFGVMAVTFLSCFFFGIDHGVFIGVALSVFAILLKTSLPNITVLGKIPGTNYYRNLERFEESQGYEDALIVRFDEKLYFGNASIFKQRIYAMATQDENESINKVLLDASNMSSIDSSGIHALKDLDNSLEAAGVDLYMCGALGPIRDLLKVSGLMKEPDKHHLSVHECVSFLEGKKKLSDNNRALQTNEED